MYHGLQRILLDEKPFEGSIPQRNIPRNTDRRCSEEKPESKTFRTAVEKQVGKRDDPKIREAIYDASVSSCS
jgi:hypothetical protein